MQLHSNGMLRMAQLFLLFLLIVMSAGFVGI